ncbi:MAG: DUF2225 domain-containing protein [Lachnospiraceae bacterium]|nr:DUF2225 domain-containing protein [Lachnospiraceae bacterium]
MGNLFTGLDSLGLGNLSSMDVYENEEKKEAKPQAAAAVKPEINEADLIFDKNYTCPVCEKEFKAKAIRTGKIKLVAADSDLRPKYQSVDSLKYDVIACPTCGYAALNRYFNYMTSGQAKLIKQNISMSFRGLGQESDIVTYDSAIMKHKLALANTVVKRAKASEKAYTCLKTAWVLRGKAENLPEDTPDYKKVQEELAVEEREFLQNAYDGFMEAFPKEVFPMCGMDENTVCYLVGELARRTGHIDDAKRWVARVLVSKTANDRIKQKAMELKDKLTSDAQ